MTDAQQLFDYARTQFNDIANDVERHFEQVALQLRDWIPSDSTFARQPPKPRRLPPPTTFQLVQNWISSHRALTAAILAFVTTGSIGTFIYIRNNKPKKRRARRSPSGARTDVVILAGSAAASPVTSALSLDLERRGFIVYVVASTAEDEHYIRSQQRADVLPLRLDLTDPFTAREQLSQFANLLGRPHWAFEGAESHRLRLVGLVLAPDTAATPAAGIEDISSEEWSDALNAKVLNTIATTQLLLPSVVEHQARLLMLTPSITPSLRLPGHGVENTVYGALQGFAHSLAAELRDSGVGMAHFKLGHIDIPAVTARQKREGQAVGRTRATPVRKLHDAVFDALVAKKPKGTWYVGRGSLAYDVIGRWVPGGVVGWMMGASRRKGKVDEVRESSGEETLRSSQGSLTWEKVDQDD
ncbi:hypothetical protein MBLNU230_g6587t1 [Neophaeotheca triangularis]